MLTLLGKLICRLLFRLRIEGPIPAQAPERLIIIPNHQSFLDGLMIGAHIPFDITWIVHTTIAAQWHFRQLLKLVPHVTVDTANPMAMKQMVQVIESGKPVCIFPEGRLTVTGSLMKVYDGVAFLAAKTNAALLPVAIDGAVYSWFTRLRAPFPSRWRPEVKLRFFPPRPLPETRGASVRERRRNASHAIRRILEENWFTCQEPTTFFPALVESARLYGRKSPILDDINFQPKTYADLLLGALALGRLVSRYSAEGETVGVLMPNAGASVMLLFGMFASRRVPAMLNYTSGVEGMQSAIGTARIRTVFTARSFLEKAKLLDKARQLRDVRLVYLEDLKKEFGLLDKLWLKLYAQRRPLSVARPCKPDDPAVVLFTSGSEGKPKGVVLSHRAVLSNIAQVRAVFEFSNRDKFLAALPLFHSFGFTVGVILPVVSGARVFLYPSPLHYRMIPEMAYDQDCTVVFGTGTFLAKYARFAHEYDFRSVRYVVAGAEKLAEAVRRTYLEKFGLRVHEGYGVTEMAPAISITTPYFYRPGSVGRILPGIEHRVVPVEGIERGGMLHVRGPNLMLGYLLSDRPGEIRPPSSALGAGWYETGDIVEIDEDGFLKIAGRVKRFAKIAGEMVSLEMVEQIAGHVSPQRAHAATAIASSKRGETILVFTEDPQLRREHVLAATRQLGLPEVAAPRAVQAVEKLPRLGSGKVDYVTLREMAEQLQGEAEVPVGEGAA